MASYSADRMVDAIWSLIAKFADRNLTKWDYGEFVSEEADDSDLSIITMGGRTMRYVNKLSHVGTLTEGDKVMVVHGGGLVITIVGVPVGDVSLATDGSDE